jgi:clan AA aspartic protease
MGIVYTEITLKNSADVSMVKRGLIKGNEVRAMTVTALVDTGAITLVINEEVRRNLGLEITGKQGAELADGTWDTYPVTEALDVHWKNRVMSCRALLLDNSSEILLGAIPLEGMDLMVSPVKGEVVGVHGEEELYKLKKAG